MAKGDNQETRTTRRTGEETEPTNNPDYFEDKGAADLPGQLVYPDREVEAERAAAYAAHKETTLDPEGEETENERVSRIQQERAQESRAETEKASEEENKRIQAKSSKSDD